MRARELARCYDAVAMISIALHQEEEQMAVDVPTQEADIDEVYDDDDQIDDLDDALSHGNDPDTQFFELEVNCVCPLWLSP